MAKFENRYGVRKIVYKQKCRCFCPIGKTDYTNEFTVTMEPAEIIPDYCEIDKFIRDVWKVKIWSSRKQPAS